MLLDNYKKKSSFIPYINTGTLLDLLTGKFIQGADSKYLLDGGLSPCTGIVGKTQTYKSSLAGTFLARALAVHPQAEAIIYETENNIPGPDRYNDFMPPPCIGLPSSPISDRIMFVSATDYTLSDFYENFIKIVDDKIQHKKDYLIESPYIDPATHKKLKIWIPTIILIDSFSKAKSSRSLEAIEDNTIDSSDLNQFWMADGNIKTKIMDDMPIRAAKAGVYVILTAHVGSNINMTNYAAPKELQYMSFNDKIKRVGSNFDFLINTMINTTSAKTLTEDKAKGKDDIKPCLYPSPFSTNMEVNEVNASLVKCKNNAAGFTVQFVISQYQGILDAVTNFHFLRKNGNYGLTEKRPETIKGGTFSYPPILYPNQDVNRKNLREITEKDYKLYRALEITAQLCFIQKLWSTWKLPEYINTPIKKVADWLTNTSGAIQDRILTSTGIWSTAKLDRERLSIIDILQLMQKEKK